MTAALEPGLAVWLNCSARYPWWPAKVIENNTLVTFQDYVSYPSPPTTKVRRYNCSEVPEMIQKGKRKLRKRKTDLKNYCEAILEAEKYIRTHLDSAFTLLEGSMAGNSENHGLKRQGNLAEVNGNGADSANKKPRLAAEKKLCDGDTKKKAEWLAAEKKLCDGDTKKKAAWSSGDSEKLASKQLEQDVISHPSVTSSTPTTGGGNPTPVTMAPDDGTGDNPVTVAVPDDGSGTGDNLVTVATPDEGTGDNLVTMATPDDGAGDSPTPACITDTGDGDGGSKEDEVSVAGTISQSEGVTKDSGVCAKEGDGSHLPSLPDSLTSSPPMPPSTLLSTSSPHWRHYMSSSSDEASDDFEDDDDDDLPTINLCSSQAFKVHELKPKQVVWVKYQHHPHWPAMVSKVNIPTKKCKFAMSVFFFGESVPKLVRTKKPKNVVPFEYKYNEKYRKEGGANKDRRKQKHFLFAFEEAMDYVQDNVDGKYAQAKTACDVMRKVVASRLTPLSTLLAELDDDSPAAGGGSPHVPPVLLLSCDTPSRSHSPPEREQEQPPAESSSSSEEEEEEEENEESYLPYSYDRVVAEIRAIEPELMQIMKGEIKSEPHRKFTCGSRKEKEGLKMANKHGPIWKWRSNKMTDKIQMLVEEVLLKIAESYEDAYFRMGYSLDVLMPEAMMRVVARVENISNEQALASFVN